MAPTCRTWGRLNLRGHAGVNRVRFRGRVEGKLLPPGTYRLLARPKGSGRIAVIRLVIAERRPDDLAGALAVSTCPLVNGDLVSDALVTSGDSVGNHLIRGPDQGRAGASTRNGSVREGGVLGAGTILGRTVSGSDALETGLLAALLAAAALLGLVALPGSAIPNARVASIVVDRRLELALAAGALIAVGATAYLLA